MWRVYFIDSIYHFFDWHISFPGLSRRWGTSQPVQAHTRAEEIRHTIACMKEL